MTTFKKLASIALLAPLGAAAALACATEGDGERDMEEPPMLDGSGETSIVPDADAGVDAPDADPCSEAGLCIVPARIDTRINITSVSGSGASDVWAVGTDRTILHYDGAVWEKADAVEPDAASFTMRAVWASGPTDVWVANGPTVFHSTGWKGKAATQWTSADLDDANAVPMAISGKSGRVIITRQVMNASADPVSAIVACRGWADGGVLEPEHPKNNPFAGVNGGLWAVSMTGPDQAWATSIPTKERPGERVMHVHLVSADGGAPDAGPSWQIDEYDSRMDKSLYGVWGDEQAVWLVGEGGAIRRMTQANMPARAFENIPSPVTSDLRGLYGFAADDVWAVGDDATVLHWDGQVWTKLASPFDAAKDKPRLFAVWGSAPNDVWIGGNGVMLHFQGTTP